MSLAIDVDKVTAVLLPDGEWYDVEGNSFDLDAYEFKHEGTSIHGGGQGGVSATGFVFKVRNRGVMYGPLTAIVAVRVGERASGAKSVHAPL